MPMRWWPPVLTALTGLALTLGLALGLDIWDAKRRIPPEPEVPEPAMLSFGAEAPANVDIVFPFERYVVDGDTQWLPQLLQLGDPDLLAADKRACISRLEAMPEDARCRVEYSFWLDPAQGRVLGIQALVLSGADSACQAYVECRLPGLASARLEVPRSELLEHPSGLRILDKVTHAKRRLSVEDEEREIVQLTALAATPDHPELGLMPAAAQRLQNYLNLTQARRLEVLRRRKQER
jgi:hypothetical protein